MTIDIYRSAAVILSPVIDQGTTLFRSLNNEDHITANFTLDSFTEILIGDYITFRGATYTVRKAPDFKKVSESEYHYTVRFNGPQYSLLDAIYLLDGDMEFYLTGTAEDFIDLIVTNLNRVHGAGTYSTGSVDTTDFKVLYFNDENCMQVLQRICEEFELEFYFGTSSPIAINLTDTIGNSTGLSYEYKSGLYNIKRTKVNNKNLITRLYPFGSEKNLGPEYTDSAPGVPLGPKLRLPYPTYFHNYIEQNVATYGVKEATKEFPDIYPHYTGTITSTSDSQHVIDTSIDFDLNSYLIEGEGKIVFLTGDLSGYEFEIISFNNSSKEVYFKTYTDEQGGTWPSGSFIPAIGDQFTFVDIPMPTAYVAAAEADLLSAATAFLDNASAPNVVYEIEMDWHELKSGAITLDVGDVINIVDSELASAIGGIDVRIVDFTQRLDNTYKYSVKLSDTILVNYFNKQSKQNQSLANSVITTGHTAIRRTPGNLARLNRIDLDFEDGATVGADFNVNLANKPAVLADINATEGNKLTGVESGATAGADFNVNLNNRPTALADINPTEGSKLTSVEDGATNSHTYAQAVAPASGMNAGDFWIDTDDSNKLYRYSGSAWVSVRDNDISLILEGSLDSRYYTETEIDNGFLPLTGGDLTGDLNVSGNVGIGTTSPSALLHVKHSTGVGSVKIEGVTRSDLYLIDTDAGTDLKRLVIRGLDGKMTIGSENDIINAFRASMTINAGYGENGYVGIGTTSPSEALDVNGNIKATGLAITNSATVGVNMGSPSFSSGFAGAGWQYTDGEDRLTVDNLTVRKQMRVYELLVEQIRANRGALVVSPGNAKILSNVAGTVTVDTGDDDRFPMSLVANDILRCQRFSGNATTSPVKYYLARVDTVTGDTFTFTIIEGTDTIAAGDEVVVFGNTTTAARQGLIYITASDDNAPYMNVLDGVTSASLTGKTKVRLGKLDGITDTDAGLDGTQSDEYGLYSENVYLKGHIFAQTGEIGGWTITDTEIGANAGAGGHTVGLSSAITAGDDIRFWAGGAPPSTAPFKVTEAGALTAVGATIKSASSGQRIEISSVSNTLAFYNSNDDKVIEIEDGSTWTGVAAIDIGGYAGSLYGKTSVGEGSIQLLNDTDGNTKSLFINRTASSYIDYPDYGVDVNMAPESLGTGGDLYAYRATISSSGGRYTEHAYGFYANIDGTSGINYGLYSEVNGSGADVNVALRAEASGATQNYAGYFVGDVYASGDMEVGGAVNTTGGTLNTAGTNVILYNVKAGDIYKIEAIETDIDSGGDVARYVSGTVMVFYNNYDSYTKAIINIAGNDTMSIIYANSTASDCDIYLTNMQANKETKWTALKLN